MAEADFNVLNLNDTTFYKRVNNVGSTTYVNVADGTRQTVPWGVVDWWNIVTGNVIQFAILGGLVWLGIHYLVK